MESATEVCTSAIPAAGMLPLGESEDLHPENYGLGTARALCQHYAHHLCSQCSSLATIIWSVDPTRHRLIQVAAAGQLPSDFVTESVAANATVSGIALATREVQFIDSFLTNAVPGRRYTGPRTVAGRKVESLISFPVLNRANPHQVLLVVDLVPMSLSLFRDQKAAPSESDSTGGALLLKQVAAQFAARFEDCLHERGVRLANRLHLRLSHIGPDERAQQLKALAETVSEALSCDGVLVYTQQPDAPSLLLQGTVGDVFEFEKTHNVIGSPADDVWRSNREVLYPSILEAPSMKLGRGRAMRRRLASAGHPIRFAFFPLRDLSGQPRGVVRCMRQSDQAREFTYEDLALLESIGRAFAPHLAVILAGERRIREMDFLAHEMRVPVTAFRAAVERIQDECDTKRYTFQYNHFSEITIYADSMRRLLWDLDLARKGPRQIILDPQLTHIESQIVAPAKRFLVPLLVRKGFKESQIVYKDVSVIPKVYVDPVLLTQLAFNLLDNAIKYYGGNPEDFSVHIDASIASGFYELRFSDNGIGIPPQFRDRIFEQWFRAPSPQVTTVYGEGLGLWYAREIARRHGGALVLEKASNRTTFLLTLPTKLAKQPPMSK